MFIEDGRGNGYKSAVTQENRLEVAAVSHFKKNHTNHHDGRAYNLTTSQSPTGADCFLYMKNESDIDLVIVGIYIRVDGNEAIDLYLNDTGTPTGGASITPTNLHAGSGYAAEGTFLEGSDITGLSGGTRVNRIYYPSSNESKYSEYSHYIILPKNRTITWYAVTGGNQIDMVVAFNYHSEIT